jgi:hypothetical protein
MKLNLADFPETVQKALIAAVRRKALTADQRKALKAYETLVKNGLSAERPNIELPKEVTILL